MRVEQKTTGFTNLSWPRRTPIQIALCILCNQCSSQRVDKTWKMNFSRYFILRLSNQSLGVTSSSLWSHKKQKVTRYQSVTTTRHNLTQQLNFSVFRLAKGDIKAARLALLPYFLQIGHCHSNSFPPSVWCSNPVNDITPLKGSFENILVSLPWCDTSYSWWMNNSCILHDIQY